ncbi:hypothetical protein GCM10010435_57690 [Winogradskya consettensis]|uniref:Uncharacterized protein n=1 Tax=Winogradskya consettensis TaxID=113560 RepID=A0A919VRU5_9ACTN|nr:hypothetical protein [Actinoplanes consettensis]GIM67066.1 hypothetical protein Aco04nite_04630 [Actinoplanes consettensis]
MPDRVGLIFIVSGVVVAAVAAIILRRATERREAAVGLRTKQLTVEVIRSSEELRATATAPSADGTPSSARLVEHDARYSAAVRGLKAGPSSAEVKTTLLELELARQQLLVAVVAHDAAFLQNAVRSLDEAIENFAMASSVMVRLA